MGELRGLQLITHKTKSEVKRYVLSYRMAVIKLLHLAREAEARDDVLELEMRPLADFSREYEIVRLEQ